MSDKKEFRAHIDINWTHTGIEARNEEEARELVKDYFWDAYDGLILEDYEIDIVEREVY
jgi:hypothetical protein